MASYEHYSGFRWEVIKKLKNRNENERKRYEDIVHLTNSLYEVLDFHQKENLRFRVSKAYLEQDVIELHKNPDSCLSKPSERASEKEILLLQEEVAELHKQKGKDRHHMYTFPTNVLYNQASHPCITGDLMHLTADA